MILLNSTEKYLKATEFIKKQKQLKEHISFRNRYFMGICNERTNTYNPDFPCQNYYLVKLDEIQDWSYFNKDGKFIERFCFECPACGAISPIMPENFDNDELEYLHEKSKVFVENTNFEF